MPLEFSRVSRDGRLTLVIDYKNGAPVETYYALSLRGDLDATVADLAAREATIVERIGFVDSVGHRNPANGRAEQAMTCAQIHSWIGASGFAAAVWTALDSNFESLMGRPFSVENAVQYLEALPESARAQALNYFKNAPREVDTPLRRRLLDLGLMSNKSAINPSRQP